MAKTDTKAKGHDTHDEPRDAKGRFAHEDGKSGPHAPKANNARKRDQSGIKLPESAGRQAAIGAAVLAGVGIGAALFAQWRKDSKPAMARGEPWGEAGDAGSKLDDADTDFSDADEGDADVADGSTVATFDDVAITSYDAAPRDDTATDAIGSSAVPYSSAADLPVTDLTEDERAPVDFRPDRDAPVPDARLDAFAPATMPVPSRVEAMGNGDD